jgi:hypothetical protein
MRNWLARIETALQSLIERTLERLAGGRVDSATIAVRAVRAMESSLRLDETGRSWAPDEYSLRMHPQDLKKLHEERPNIVPFLKEAIVQAARDGDALLAEEPHIVLIADYKMARNRVRVEAVHGEDTLDYTRQMPALGRIAPEALAGAALVGVDGQAYPLGSEVVGIGRMRDNQIVISDPRVSRRHAQVCLREGHHVILDLGSTAGTRVNGKPIMERVLRHGDVITCAGHRLVYQQGDVETGAISTNDHSGASP